MSKIVHPAWQKKIQTGVPHKLKSWLQDPGSFMARLASFGVKDARIEVLNQAWVLALPEEAQQLQLKDGHALIREVFIKSHERFWMFARTIFHPAIFAGETIGLTQLQNQSLGSVLFSYPGIQRSEFEFLQFDKNDVTYPHMTALTERPLWARRSIFSLPQKSLLLIEVFTSEILNL